MTEPPESPNAFAPVSKDEWIAKVEADLKGASLDSLSSATNGGLPIAPLYTESDAPSLDVTGVPGLFPFVRGATPLAGWKIRQEYDDPRVETCAELIRRDLERGVEAIFVRGGPRHGCRMPTVDNLDQVLESVDLEKTSVYFDAGADTVALAAGLVAVAERRGVGAASLRGCVGADPIGRLAREGRLEGGLHARLTEVRDLGAWCSEHAPTLSALCVSGDPYHEGGASTSQELGALTATGVAYLRELIAAGLSVAEAARQIRFALPIAGNFFEQIAKLRAARWLWAKVLTAAGVEPSEAAMRIHARTSMFTKTERDPWVNMLRATSECTAAILGGAQSIATLPFDVAVGSPDALAQRVARNTQFVLREESHLDVVADPAGGSWFVETLTRQIAESAWLQFQEIEKKGGIVDALGAGHFSDAIDGVVDQTRSGIAKRKAPIVGVSEFPNLDEERLKRERVTADDIKRSLQQALDDLDLGAHRGKLIAIARLSDKKNTSPGELMDACISATIAGADMYTIATVLQHGQPDFYLEPIPQWRQSDAWEGLRDRSDRQAEADGSRPAAFMTNLGAIADHKARSTWAQNLLGAAGINAVTKGEFDSAEAAATAYAASPTGVVMISGSDTDYERLLKPTIGALKAAGCDHILVAGRPGSEEEALRELGATDFVYVGADVLSAMRRTLDALGIGR